MSNHHVVILSGGKGVRLRPYTACFPKPLVPIGDSPILAVLLQQLINQGFREVTLALGHLAELIRAYITQHPTLTRDIKINFVDEESPTGTAGSLANIAGLSDPFLVMNGDVLTDLDLNSLISEHEKNGSVLTIAGYEKQVKIDLGVLEADESGRLYGYVEKPQQKFEVSMGIYVYDSSVLSFIEPNTYLDLPMLVCRLLEAGEPVYVHRNNAFWLDIGRPEDYARAQEIVESNPNMFGIGKSRSGNESTRLQSPRLVLKNKMQPSNV